MRARLCLLMLLVPALVAAGEPVRVVLHDSATVAADVILLCDVASVEGGQAPGLLALSLGNAPWPGNRREVSRELVQARLASAGYDLGQIRIEGAQSCVVERASTKIAGERVAEQARRALRACYEGTAYQASVELLRPVPDLFVPAEGGEVRLVPRVAGGGPPAGAARVDVDVVQAGRRVRTVPVSLHVRVNGPVLVATAPIPVGSEVGPQNATQAVRDVTALYGTPLRSLEQAVGFVAARPIDAGEIVTLQALRQKEPPVVIRRNQRVFLMVRTDTLRVVTLGIAQNEARQGEPVRAKNLDTGREVIGVARADGTVEVSLQIGEGSADGAL